MDIRSSLVTIVVSLCFLGCVDSPISTDPNGVASEESGQIVSTGPDDIASASADEIPPFGSDRDTSDASRKAITLAGTVSIELPESTPLEVLQKGAIERQADSYLLVIGDPEKVERLAITVLPRVQTQLDWESAADEWQSGLSTKMSRMIRSETATLNGMRARHLVAEVDTGENTLRLEIDYMMTAKRSYTVSLSGPSSNAISDVALIEARESFKITE
ncbi:MAG: hypothetical protein ACPGLY_07615 [Rubripirellula sp.]